MNLNSHSEREPKRFEGPWFKFFSIAAFFGVVAVLFLFNPSQFRFYPVCWFFKWTGLQCPGCGILRATHQLLHGNIETAFGLNPFYVIALGLGILGGIYWAIASLIQGRRVLIKDPLKHHPVISWIAIGLFILFGILRNF